MKKRAIVITTINSPTIAVKKIASMYSDTAEIIVIGDKKTPSNWYVDGIRFVSFEEQSDLFPKLSELIPANHYCRKNIGYLIAIQSGALEILETDDDNIPYLDFGINANDSNGLISGVNFCNIYSWFTDRNIWPRGLPLDEINSRGHLSKSDFSGIVGIVQWLADEDPDVDAIYRLTRNERVVFERNKSYILDKNVWCPFNSQNTLFYEPAFHSLYLPCFVSFRMTDIWRSFVAQKLLWEQGLHIQFSASTVAQERNPHDLMKDFNDEVVGYIENKRIISILSSVDLSKYSIADRPMVLYRKLYDEGLITSGELKPLELFLENIYK